MIHDLPSLLTDAIILLKHDSSEAVKKDIQKLVAFIDNEKSKTVFQDPQLVKFLSSIVSEFLKQDDTTQKGAQAELLVKIATNSSVGKYPQIKEAISTIFTSDTKYTTSQIKKLKNRVKNNITWHQISISSKKLFKNLGRVTETTDEDQQGIIMEDLVSTAKHILETDDEEHRFLKNSDRIERIDMTDVSTIIPAIRKFKESEFTAVFKTPLQGFNRMCGYRGGIALGESVNINGCSGMYKSGLLTLLAEGIVQYNLPPASIIQEGIPLVLFISCENEANKNMMKWFKQAYARQHQKWPDIKNLADEDIARFIADTYGSYGYKLLIERRQGANFGYDEFCELIEDYEALGYRVCCVVLDYLKKMKLTTKLLQGGKRNEDSLINFLFENMCGYCKTKGITFITANQLNRDALKIASDTSTRNIVKLFGSHLTGSALGPLQEIDLNIFIHLEYNQYKTRYLTVMRDKHRYVDDTPLAHQYFAYPFCEFGIMPDIGKAPGFVSDIYGVEPPDGYMTGEKDADESAQAPLLESVF